jgi:hypothetical protein
MKNTQKLLVVALSAASIASPLYLGEAPLTAESDSLCSSIWEQCGGKDWKGPLCCDKELACIYSNEW